MASRFEIPIQLCNSSGFPFRDYPIEQGIPFPRGLLKEADAICLLSAARQPVPCDITPMLRWPDGSPRWVFLRFLASDNRYHLCQAENVSQPPQSLFQISEDRDELRIDTGASVYAVSREIFRLSSLSPPFSTDPELLTDCKGRRYKFRIVSLVFEHRGNVCVVLGLRGLFVDGRDRKFCHGICRLSFWAGTGLVRAEFTLWNPNAARHRGGLWDLGDAASVFFRSLHVCFRFPASGSTALSLSVVPGEEIVESYGAPLSIHQSSSGGPNWRSLVHVDRNNIPTTRFRGFRLCRANETVEGLKANPAIVHRKARPGVAFAMESFWERFPSRLEATDHFVSVEPFPASEGQEFELQGGEQATFRLWVDSSCSQSAENIALLPARVPIIPVLPPQWCCDTGCFPPMAPIASEDDPFFRNLVASAIEGSNSFFSRRERWEEYGWRNFGDIPADHERMHYRGSKEFVSHYNNQYDLILGFIGQFVTTGDCRWFILARDLSRHVLDHDIYHTSLDKAAYNGGYFWHTAHYLHAGTATHRSFSRMASGGNSMPRSFGGGPSNEHNYSTGLLYYYLLSGDIRAKNSVLELASWVREMQAGVRTPYRFLSLNDTGWATCTGDLAYQGPGRGGAYSINTCLDAFTIDGNPEWLELAERLMAICIHPADDPAALDLLNREARWSYVVFLQTLGKFLDLKLQCGSVDTAFHYAATCLEKFARWMASAEYPYLDRPEQLEYPTSTWAAQELRKAYVFLAAAEYAHEETTAATFEEKAEYFVEKSREFLRKAEDRDSARNLAIILANIPIYFSFQSRGVKRRGVAIEEFDWGPRCVLIPQKIEARKNLLRIVRTGGLALPAHLIRILRQMRRARTRSSRSLSE